MKNKLRFQERIYCDIKIHNIDFKLCRINIPQKPCKQLYFIKNQIIKKTISSQIVLTFNLKFKIGR